MKQKWSNLMFAHWEYDPAVIQEFVPKPLFVDALHGKAYVGVVALKMSHIRYSWMPENFNAFSLIELNLRTYVETSSGDPGVHFFTCESDHFLGNYFARGFYKLPYSYSKLQYFENMKTHEFAFHGKKKKGGKNYRFDYEFKIKPETQRLAKKDPLDRFLVERYSFYQVNPQNRKIYHGTLSHDPFIVNDITLTHFTTDLFEACNIPRPEGPPVHSCFSYSSDIQLVRFQGLEHAQDKAFAEIACIQNT